MSNGNEIAIIGMSGRFPSAATLDELWDILRDGREPLRATEQDTASAAMSDQVSHMVRANSILPGLDKFDAAFFGLNPREAEMTDPQHRLFLECAWEALEDAGVKVGDRARPIGVFAGTGMTSYVFGQIEHGAQILDAFPSIIATDKDFVSTRVSFKLNLTGPSMTIQCACSTSMVAVHLACQSLIAGECDAAIAGGVAAAAPQQDSYKFMPGGMLAPDGRCRPFDADGRGTVFADGAAVVTLMRLDDAVAGGYPIRAVILGSAVNNDGAQKPGYTAPTVEGQVRVVNQALAVAGIEASDLDFIEAHGTGTVLGDAIEIGALTKVMRASTDEIGGCVLGSIKSNIGHVLAAAGVAGIIKTVLTLENQAIPACANFETPNPDLDLATSPFAVNTALKAWDKPTKGIRRAGVSSFGVGGTNAHMIIEEAPRRTSGASRRAWHVLPLSARAEVALGDVTNRMRAFLGGKPSVPFADTVYTAQIARRAFEHRRVVIARDAGDALEALTREDAARVLSRKAPQQAAKVAFMFTGQGSQYPGMGADLYRDEPVFAEAAERCLACLDPAKASALRDLVFAVDADVTDADRRLRRTETAQLALFVMHYALADMLAAWGVKPAIMIGHSIGEYAAACVSGVLSLKDALDLVALRGRLMGAMDAGAMLSVAADPHDLPALPQGLAIAAVNAPKLCVVAGPADLVAAYDATLTQAGIGTRLLQTSHAFHSAMMEPMLPAFKAAVSSVAFNAPAIPYVSSLTGALAGADDVADPDFWTRQIRNPVLFAKGCETLAQQGVTVVVEVGPGRGLSALARQCGLTARGAEIVTLLPEPSDATMRVATALGRLWLAGAEIDWQALYQNETRLRVALPTYPFNRQSYWIDPALNFNPTEKADKRPDEKQWFHVPSWTRLGPVSVPAPSGTPARVLVVGDTEGLAGSVAALIAARGDHVTTLADTSPAALDALLQGWTGADDTPDRIVHLTSIADGKMAATFAETAFWARQDRDTMGLLRLLQTIGPIAGGKPLAVHIVSTGLYDVTGADPVVPDNAPLVTFARVAAQEVANVTCRLVDIEPIGAKTDLAGLAQRIETRLGTSGPKDTVVALRNNRAWRLDFEQIDAGTACTARRTTRPRGVYLITGGLGKVGLVYARYLAKTCQARLVLVGRSPIPAASAWDSLLKDPASNPDLLEKIAAIRELEAMGAEVLVASADVSDTGDMAAVMARATARFGAIDGFIHCAGVTTVGRVLLDTGLSEFEQNFRSKVFGLIVLDTLLGDKPLDFGIVVSSLSTILGGLGHMSYAAANAFADAFVQRRNQTGTGVWTTVNWDAWKFEQGRVDSVQAILNMLDFSLDETEGARAIDLLFQMETPEQVIVSTGSLGARVRLWIEQHATPGGADAGRAGGRYERPDVETPFAEPEGPIEQKLAAIWRDALGLDKVGRNDDFFEIGGHSLLAMQILAKTRDGFGVDFPIERALEAARLSSAAAVIASLLDAKTKPDVTILPVEHRLEAAE